MKLSVVIVNWNTKALLKWCLHYLFTRTKDLEYEVFVVDNASSDGSAEMVEDEFPEVKLIKNKKNLGFAKANNKAIKKAKGKYILLLNADTKILDNALARMVEFMENNKECSVAGPRLLNPDNTLQPSCREFPSLLNQAFILLKLHNFFPNSKLIRKYYMLDFMHDEEREVDQVMGAAFMARKKLIKEIGLLDEGYFIWFEEVDYCKRVKEAGYKVMFTPSAEIIHEKAASFNQVLSIKKQRMLNASMLRYFRKHESAISYLAILILYPVSILLAAITQIIQKHKSVEKKKYL